MATKAKGAGDIFDPANEVQANWIKFNVPGEDRLFGTLIAKRSVKSTFTGKEGQVQNIYDIKTEYGTFHRLDDKKKLIEEPVEVSADDIWSVGGTVVIDPQMRNVKIGQKIGFKFVEEKPSKTKGWAPAKIIKVYTPRDEETGDYQMDTEWLAENKDTEAEFKDF